LARFGACPLGCPCGLVAWVANLYLRIAGITGPY
jgi:hypothetical protein